VISGEKKHINNQISAFNSFSVDYKTMCRLVNSHVVAPNLWSVRGVVARGTLFMSKGFSVGSNVYWWRDFSSPGIETDKPESDRHKRRC